MHMSDALVSPLVGGVGWATALALAGHSARHLATSRHATRPALMGVLGAFVFAGQMINFAIPGTGSSGHIGGGLLLAVLLGPHAGFLVMMSILTVQALLFADGGLLALGCNAVNLGFFTCFLAYPLLMRPWVTSTSSRLRLTVVTILSVVVGLQMGALFVVLQTVLSGISELPFVTFLTFMLPIHLAIGLVEGLMTAGILGYLLRVRPELVSEPLMERGATRSLLASFSLAAVLLGGVLSWFASSRPDGLEWSLEAAAGSAESPGNTSGLGRWLESLQARTSLLPDYSVPNSSSEELGVSVSGLVGGAVTLLVIAGIGLSLRQLRRRGR
jgi:cobalt/nickel transport system permease protein